MRRCRWPTARSRSAEDDLELLATAAYMIGRQEEYFDFSDGRIRAHVERGDGLPAADCAGWIGMKLAQKGEMGQAGGWLARARRLVEREDRECVERGYLLMPRCSSGRRPATRGRDRDRGRGEADRRALR